LAEARFYAWRRLLAQRDAEQRTLVPVEVLSDSSPGSGRMLEVLLIGGRRLRVPCGFDAATLRQLLAVLEEDPAC
jgi:hypothetical protein